MARKALLRVDYTDGTSAEFNANRPALLLAMERKFGVQQPNKHEHVFWLAHAACGDGEKFNDWIERVEVVEPVEQDDADPDADDDAPGK